MAELPEVVAEAAELRATQRLARYAEELAGTFHRFYTECRCWSTTTRSARARYWLAVAAKQVLANALGCCGCPRPERM
jgi:arginyl-tRNA synthetase